MSNKYILTSSTTELLQKPKYFNSFEEMVGYVTSEFRNDLIENDASYKQIMDFDSSIKYTNQWFDINNDETFIKIDHDIKLITAKTSTLSNYGLNFIGEQLPNDNVDKTKKQTYLTVLTTTLTTANYHEFNSNFDNAYKSLINYIQKQYPNICKSIVFPNTVFDVKNTTNSDFYIKINLSEEEFKIGVKSKTGDIYATINNITNELNEIE